MDEVAAQAGAGLRLAVLVTAAGRSARFGGGKKELVQIEGRSVLDRALSPFLSLSGLEALVLTAPPGGEEEIRASLSRESLDALGRLGPGGFAIVPGGSERRDSVRQGLEALGRMLGSAESAPAGLYNKLRGSTKALDDIVVLVHDGARPWLSSALAQRVAALAAEKGACVPVVPLVDTPKELGQDGTVLRHPERSAMGGAQTPQGFRLGSLLAAHRRAAAEDRACTDDAELWAAYVGPVAYASGEEGNRKITLRADLGTEGAAGEPRFDASEEGAATRRAGDTVESDGRACDGGAGAAGATALAFRVGQGWDRHRLVAGRALVLGGVEIPSELGEDAHSDGDVLLHAIIDALLGAAALGDIGTHFPPSEQRWKGADSRELARMAVALVREAGWEPGNLDCTVTLERPRLGPYRDALRASIASCLGMERSAVSFKAKTAEGLDAAGELKAVEAAAVVSLFPRGRSISG